MLMETRGESRATTPIVLRCLALVVALASVAGARRYLKQRPIAQLIEARKAPGRLLRLDVNQARLIADSPARNIPSSR
jgi:hypothetical protein